MRVKSLFQLWSSIHVARNISQVTIHVMEIQGNIMKDIALFYFKNFHPTVAKIVGRNM